MREINDTLWLGKLPKTWNTVELGQVYEERKVKVKETIYEPLSVTMKGIVPQLASAVKAAEGSDRKLVKAGDFVINSRSDRKGACGVSEKDGSCSVINIVIRPRNLQTAEYYNYALLSVYFPEEFYRWGHGIASDLWTTRWSEMRKIKLPNPPDSVKEKIVFHIKNKCNEIAKLEKDTRRIIEDYKILKNSYIEDLVVHGVRKCESWKKSDERGFGNIPSHWHMLKIKRIFNILCGEFKGFPIRVSMGVSCALECGGDYETLFRMADEAMYAVKQRGRNGYCFYNEDLKTILKSQSEDGESQGAERE